MGLVSLNKFFNHRDKMRAISTPISARETSLGSTRVATSGYHNKGTKMGQRGGVRGTIKSVRREMGGSCLRE
jgi:hypothetical protein